MGREVRRVPATWEHPKGSNGSYTPLYDGDYQAIARRWLDEAIAWDNDTHEAAAEHKAEHSFYWEWDGQPPQREDYMPSWPDAERTHYQMYETTSEGTPISPVMESPETLALWLTDNRASAFAGQTASYESWLRVCNGGYAVSAVMTGGEIISGVEAMTRLPESL